MKPLTAIRPNTCDLNISQPSFGNGVQQFIRALGAFADATGSMHNAVNRQLDVMNDLTGHVQRTVTSVQTHFPSSTAR